MYIIYNNDGSIKSIKLTDFIQRGNNNVNSIFLAIEGKTNQEWAATIIFTLPDGSNIPITPYAKTKEIFNTEYSGWQLDITASLTVYEGLLKFSIAALNLQNQTLFTYVNKLVINPSIIVPDVTTITYDQYNHLLQYITSVIGEPESDHRLYRHEVHVILEGEDEDIYYVIDSPSDTEITTLDQLKDVFGGENVQLHLVAYINSMNYGAGFVYSSKVANNKLDIDAKFLNGSLTGAFIVIDINDVVRSA